MSNEQVRRDCAGVICDAIMYYEVDDKLQKPIACCNLHRAEFVIVTTHFTLVVLFEFVCLKLVVWSKFEY